MFGVFSVTAGWVDGMTNSVAGPQPNGDVGIALYIEEAQAVAHGEGELKPEPTVDPANLDHPEELFGE